MSETARTIGRILKVNHAGEYSAINIYRAQLLIARLWQKDLVPFLSETLAHEINHRSHFRNAMHERNAKPCAAMPLWAIGGGVLGLITALMGCNAVMICTKAVEQTVHRHLDDQLRFLASRDKALYDLIAAIQVEEDMHLDYASAHLRPSWLVAPLESVINVLTEVLIWLSTQGAVSRMEKAVRR